jgi:hypothetical protein
VILQSGWGRLSERQRKSGVEVFLWSSAQLAGVRSHLAPASMLCNAVILGAASTQRWRLMYNTYGLRTLIRCRSAAGRSPPRDTKRVLENPRPRRYFPERRYFEACSLCHATAAEQRSAQHVFLRPAAAWPPRRWDAAASWTGVGCCKPPGPKAPYIQETADTFLPHLSQRTLAI